MADDKCYENYPFWFVLLSNFLQLAIYVIGAVIIQSWSWVALAFFIAYILCLEIRLLKGHCVDCYYYGKFCAFGKGRLSALFFKRGDPKNFVKNKITWKDILPDFMVSIIPLVVGIVFLVKGFDRVMLALVVSSFLLTFIGTGLVRGSLACKHCKQRIIGCPAERLFSKKPKHEKGA